MTQMPIRPFRPEDAPALAALSRSCAKAEADFVLNPLWESESELVAEFARHGIDPESHLLVAEHEREGPIGLVGFVRHPDERMAGLMSPIIHRAHRGHGLGGQLLRAGLELGDRLGIQLVTAAIGTRNRLGYALLTGLGFLPVRQHFLMRCETAPDWRSPSGLDVTVEVAKPEDAEGILAIYQSAGFPHRSEDRMRELLGGLRHFHAVARQGDEVVGFAEIETHWPRRVWVAYVGVATGLRNRGLGTSLVGWSLQRQFEGVAEDALLLLSPANRTALRAYEKVGFRHHRTIDVLERQVR